MAEMLDDAGALESTTVGVYRTAATVKGGRRFSFSSLVVVGDRNGRVGFGYGKANQVPPAIEKAQKEARRRLRTFPQVGRTIPHEVTGRYGSCRVRLIPASPGTGVIAGAAVRAVLEMFGLQDCLTKCYGSTNSKNLVKAVVDGLSQLKSKQLVESLRGVDLDQTVIEASIARSEAFLAAAREERTGRPTSSPNEGSSMTPEATAQRNGGAVSSSQGIGHTSESKDSLPKDGGSAEEAV